MKRQRGKEEWKCIFKMELNVEIIKSPMDHPYRRAYRHVPKSTQDLEYHMCEN